MGVVPGIQVERDIGFLVMDPSWHALASGALHVSTEVDFGRCEMEGETIQATLNS